MKNVYVFFSSLDRSALTAFDSSSITSDTGPSALDKLAQIVFLGPAGLPPIDILGLLAIFAGAGALVAWLVSPHRTSKAFRLSIVVLLGIAGYLDVLFYQAGDRISLALMSVITFLLAYVVARDALMDDMVKGPFGKSRWESVNRLRNLGMLGNQPGGLFLGRYYLRSIWPWAKGTLEALKYRGDMHSLVVAGTRSMKTVSMVITNALRHQGGLIVYDIKGEIAHVTVAVRRKMGKTVHVVDPFHATQGLGKRAAFNPLSGVAADSDNFAETCTMLADALIVREGAESRSSEFFDNESRTLLAGLIGFVATDLAFAKADRRNLISVRELLLQDADGALGTLDKMASSDHTLVRSAGIRHMQKRDETAKDVWTTVQMHTEILDNDALRACLQESSFTFRDVHEMGHSVYLVMPPSKAMLYNRFTRLVLQSALNAMTEDLEKQPEAPTLVLMDEFATLGHMTFMPHLFSISAGYGVRLMAVVQNLTQLKSLYSDAWESIFSNCGVVQYLGGRDKFTCEYFSTLAGTTTIKTVTKRLQEKLFGDNETLSSIGSSARPFLYPEEVATLSRRSQLLFVEDLQPILAKKAPYFEDLEMLRLIKEAHAEYTDPEEETMQKIMEIMSRAGVDEDGGEDQTIERAIVQSYERARDQLRAGLSTLIRRLQGLVDDK